MWNKLCCWWIAVASLGHIAPPKPSQAESQGSHTSQAVWCPKPTAHLGRSPGLEQQAGRVSEHKLPSWEVAEGTGRIRRAQAMYSNTIKHLSPPHRFPTIQAHDPLLCSLLLRWFVGLSQVHLIWEWSKLPLASRRNQFQMCWSRGLQRKYMFQVRPSLWNLRRLPTLMNKSLLCIYSPFRPSCFPSISV